ILDAGARVVGGCCGTTPTQLAATVQAAAEHRRRTDAAVVTAAPETAVGAVPAASFTEPGQLIVELTAPPTGGVDESLDVAAQLRDTGVRLISVAASRSARAQVNPVDLALHLHQLLGIDTLAS